MEKKELYFNLFAVLYMTRRRKRIALKSHRSGSLVNRYWISLNLSFRWKVIKYLYFTTNKIFCNVAFQRHSVLVCLKNVVLLKKIQKSSLRKEISGSYLTQMQTQKYKKFFGYLALNANTFSAFVFKGSHTFFLAFEFASAFAFVS